MAHAAKFIDTGLRENTIENVTGKAG
jgi:hypothetical protein